MEQRGQALLPIEQEQARVDAGIRRALQGARQETHGLIAGVEHHERADGIATQHGHDEGTDAVFVPGISALEGRELNVPALHAGEQVREIETWRRETHGHEVTLEFSNPRGDKSASTGH